MQNWDKFDWEGTPEKLFDSIRIVFKSLKVNVKVEFFRPQQANAKDFIVVAEDSEEKEKGILLPRTGVVLDMHMAFDLFKGGKGGEQVSPGTIVSFPRVKREYKDTKFVKTYWRVTKHGEFGK